jgi:hypothetical protein
MSKELDKSLIKTLSKINNNVKRIADILEKIGT